METHASAGTTGSGRRLRITWVRSTIGYRQSQRLTIKSLGLKRLNQTVEHYDSPSIQGMINKVQHLVRVEEAPASEVPVQRETGTQRFKARQAAKAAAWEALITELLTDEAEDEVDSVDALVAIDAPAVVVEPAAGGDAGAITFRPSSAG